MFGIAKNNKGKTEKNQSVLEGPCIFPFKHGRPVKVYNECIPSEKGPKCATEVSKYGTLKKYGYCVEKSKKQLTKKKRKLKIIEDETKPHTSMSDTKPTPPHNKQLTKKKRKLKIIEDETEPHTSMSDTKPTPPYNKQFIEKLNELETLMQKKGEFMRSRAYNKAQQALIVFKGDINSVDQIKDLKGIGKTITKKMEEYVTTGKIEAIEKEKLNPIYIFTNIYGVGPKKAQDLVDKGISTIVQLRENTDLLNDNQKLGLQYYDDINKRIPRNEINAYKTKFTQISESFKAEFPDSSIEIVGSYRRGVKTSGDIDVIITDKNNKKAILNKFISELKKEKILLHQLTDGKTKIMGISQLPTKPARRIDILYTSPTEYPFAILYFTGSKIFNTIMRQRALNMGYTLNEHGIYHMTDGKKSSKVNIKFDTEADIFKFLNMKYRDPPDRTDSRAITSITVNSDDDDDVPDTGVGEVLVPDNGDEDVNLVDNSIKFSKNLEKTLNKTGSHVKIAKKHMKEFMKHGVTYLNKLTELEIHNIVKHSNDIYFNNPEETILTDEQFDMIKDYLYEKYPKNLVLKEIGAPLTTGKNKVTLPYNMPSMNKFKTEQEINKWIKLNNNPSNYMITPKLDGSSGLYIVDDKGKANLYTRGDGQIGQDISHFIPHLNLPKDKNIALRGEFIISKDNFKEHFKDRRVPRNTVAGIMNKHTIDKKVIKQLMYVDFVVYEAIKPTKLSPSEQFEFAKQTRQSSRCSAGQTYYSGH